MAQNVFDPNSWFAEHLSGSQQKFVDFAVKVYDEGALHRKTKEMIAVAVSCQHRCRHCTRAHIEAALEAGASKTAVAETLSVLWVIGAGTNVVSNNEGFEAPLHSAPVDA